MTVSSRTRVVFYCPESFSLFEGGHDGPRSGGAGIKIYNAASQLAKSDKYEVSFLFPDDVKQLTHPTITFHHIRSPIKQRAPVLSRYLSASQLDNLLPGDGPLVMVSTMDEYVERFTSYAKRLDAVSIYWVASDHDVISPRGVASDKSKDVLDLIAGCDGVIAQSQYQQDVLLQTRGKQSLVIPTGWPLGDDPPPIDEREYVLWVGAIKYHKQPWYFIDLAIQNPGEQFVMIGPPTQESQRQSSFYSYVINRAKEVPNLTFIDQQISLSAIGQYFRDAKVFVNTSAFEGFPNTFIQAMGAGTPLLSLNVNPDGFMETANCGICANGNLQQLDKALGKLLNDDELRSEMGLQARRYAVARHDITKTIHQLERMIQSVLKSCSLSGSSR